VTQPRPADADLAAVLHPVKLMPIIAAQLTIAAMMYEDGDPEGPERVIRALQQLAAGCIRSMEGSIENKRKLFAALGDQMGFKPSQRERWVAMMLGPEEYPFPPLSPDQTLTLLSGKPLW